MNRSRAFLLRQAFAAFLTAVGSAGLAAQAHAATNAGFAPPAGALFDLNGLPAPTDAATYTFEFIAGATQTPIEFLFRDDPSFLEFFAPSVVNVQQPNVNLLQNANFRQTTSSPGQLPEPTDWTYAKVSALTDKGGHVIFGGYASSPYWIDGAEQGYDSITQTITTTPGAEYKVSFSAAVFGGVSQWSRVSTNGNPSSGGNGADILTYAFKGRPVPEPSTWGMLAIGFLGLAYLRWRRRAAAAPG